MEEIYTTEASPMEENNTSTMEDVVRGLNQFALPILIFGGLLGNSISFAVLTHSRPLKQLTSTVYLAFLNVVDSLFLLVLLSGWLGWLGVSIFHLTGSCQIIIYLSYVSSFLSTWGVVSFTVERFIAIHYPLKHRALCSRVRAIRTVLALSAAALAFYAYNLRINGVVDVPVYGKMCVTYPEYDSVARVLTGIDTAVTVALPSVLIVVFNIAIVLRIRKAAKTPLSSSINHPPLTSTQSVRRDAVCSRTTVWLLVVSSVFVGLNLPSHSLRLHLASRYLLNTDTKVTDQLQRWQQVLQLLSYLNYAVNFFLYCACSKSFRSGVRNLCRDFRNKGYSGVGLNAPTRRSSQASRQKSEHYPMNLVGNV